MVERKTRSTSFHAIRSFLGVHWLTVIRYLLSGKEESAQLGCRLSDTAVLLVIGSPLMVIGKLTGPLTPGGAGYRFTDMIRKIRFWPVHGWVGLVSVAVCWLLNWMLPGVRTAYLFFPLWLGYVLVVDALVWTRTGSSIWSRSRKDFVLLFCFSAPVWWWFELFNLRTANWEYLGRDLFTPLQYYLLCTIAFSIVVPAVFETAALIQTFRWMKPFRSGPRVPATPPVFVTLFVVGLAMLISVMAWPKIFYPFTWTSLVLIFEPVHSC